MERKTADDFDQDLLILFDAYVHGDIDRRGFLDRAAKFAVGGMTAAMLLDALNPRFAEAQVVPKDDKRLKTEYLEFDSPQGSGKARGYLARPASATGKLPAVLVVHENRGLNPHIEDIARRLALDNFMAFAPDALFALGGYPGDEDKARELFGKLDQAKIRQDFIAATQLLMKRPDSTGKVGVVGFCYGGAMANTLATLVPELAAAVPFYGTAAESRGRAEYQGRAPDPLRGDRPEGQCQLSSIRGGLEGQQDPVPRPTRTPARSMGSTTTPLPDSMPRLQSSRGRGHSSSSTSDCAEVVEDMPLRHIVIVIGVTGSGKSTVARALADRLGWRFHDADDLHAPEHVEQMRRNIPLTDEQRQPWLLRVRAVVDEAVRDGRGEVIACSALKARYRDTIAGGLDCVRFVYLTGDLARLRERLDRRPGHFAGSGLLDSQLQVLEPPLDALTLDIEQPVDALVDAIVQDIQPHTPV